MDEEKMDHASDAAPSPDLPEASAVQPENTKEDAAQSPTTSNPDELPATPGAGPDEGEMVTGFKLAVIMIAITMAAFLMLLDVSIVATVRASAVGHEFEVVLIAVGGSTDHE